MIGGLAAQRVTPLFESAVAVIAPCALNRVSVKDDSWTSTPLRSLRWPPVASRTALQQRWQPITIVRAVQAVHVMYMVESFSEF